MNAGYYAIKLRSEFHHFFYTADDNSSNDGHHYCILVLKRCYKLLDAWMKEYKLLREMNHIDEQLKNTTLGERSNRYSVLDDEESILKEDCDADNAATLLNSKLQGITIEEIDRKMSDIRVRALRVFHDMMEMNKKLLLLWTEVRQNEKSILTVPNGIAHRNDKHDWETIMTLFTYHKHYFNGLQPTHLLSGGLGG